jgi:beta-glucosidase
MGFPEGFVWGAATSAYQIEGAAAEDGRGESIWDRFCQREGTIYGGHTGAVACDHYHRFREDVALMAALGLKAYRLSISWPRVLPEGTGRVNARGLAFYERLVDALLEAGVTPWVTLFHWDLPQALFHRGGWLSPRMPEWFAGFTQTVVGALSDRVKHWITLNEPQVFVGLGHEQGIHAPGLKLSRQENLLMIHHALLAHGRAVQVIRERARTPPQIGWAPVGVGFVPHTNRPEDIAAAREKTFAVEGTWNSAWYSDPVFLGRYPEAGLRFFGADAPPQRAAELELIRQPLDFSGVNVYRAERVRAGAAGPEVVPRAPGAPRTAFDWPVEPDCLYWVPRFYYERYRRPIIVTENGLSCRDWKDLDGRVRDPSRIDFLRRHLLALRRAVDHNVVVAGYFQWSFMDNFEWAEGYRQRFGLIHVDYQTLARTPKDSARWYGRVIATNGRSLDETPA